MYIVTSLYKITIIIFSHRRLQVKEEDIDRSILFSLLYYIYVNESFHLSSFVRGYHEYQRLWTPRIGEGLVVKQERDNHHD